MKLTRLVYLSALVAATACTDGTDASTDKDTDSDTDTVDTDTIDTDTETVDTEIIDTEIVDTEIVDTEIVDTEIIDTEIIDTEIIDTEPPDTDTDTDIPVAPGLLMITEVGDNPNPSDLKWIEIWNPGSVPIPLAGFTIDLYANGSSTRTERWVGPPVIMVDPGEVKVIGAFGLFVAQYSSVFGAYAVPDDFSLAVSGNGNDTYVLAYQGVIMDIYGEIGVNGTGQPWNYTDAVAWRDPAVLTPNTTWTASEWTISTAVVAGTGLLEEQSIGVHPPGAFDTDIPVDSDNDTFDPALGYDTFDTDLADPDPIITYTMADVAPGQLVITEFMANPGQCDDSRGEYIEVTSLVPENLNLDGLQVQNATTSQTITLSGGVIVTPGSPVLIWLDPGTPPGDCYGFGSVGVPYTSLELGNTGGILRLRSATAVIDQVDYTGFVGMREGVAMELSEDMLDATLNDDPANWCLANTPIPGAFDLGSPTFGNDICPPPDTDTDTGNTYVPPDTDTDTDTDTDPVIVPVDDLVPGDLLISEFMVEPSNPCVDPGAEYVEVYNTTASWVDLDGLVVSSDHGSTTITGRAWVAPDDVMVLFRASAITGCYANRWPFPSFRSIAYPPTVEFVSAGDVVRIANAGGILDTVDYSGWAPTSVRGAAWSVDRRVSRDTVLNDLQANWCADGVTLGTGNLGTVGLLLECSNDTDTDSAVP